jgi:hypothetical protein
LRNTVRTILNLKMQLPPAHFGPHISMDQQIKNKIYKLVGVIKPAYHEKVRLLLQNGVRRW